MKQIRLTKGLYALVNDEDFLWLNQWNWCASFESRGTKVYAIRSETINGKRTKIRMHVEIVKYNGIDIPPGHVVDHCNHNSLDNRLWNDQEVCPQLEVITQAENMKRSLGWKKKGQKFGSVRARKKIEIGKAIDGPIGKMQVGVATDNFERGQMVTVDICTGKIDKIDGNFKQRYEKDDPFNY